MKPETKQYLAYKLRRIARDRQIRDKFKKKNDWKKFRALRRQGEQTMKKMILIFALFLSACTDPHGANITLRRQGYENITITGYDFFGCGKGDTFHTGFVAYKDGNRIEGVVCSSLFTKASTIRFY